MSQFTYERIERTSPSGKTLYRCRVCGDVTPAPCKYPYHACLDFNPWVSVEDCMPAEIGPYIVFVSRPGSFQVAGACFDPEQSVLFPKDTRYWMPVPRLPGHERQ